MVQFFLDTHSRYQNVVLFLCFSWKQIVQKKQQVVNRLLKNLFPQFLEDNIPGHGQERWRLRKGLQITDVLARAGGGGW